MSRLGFLAVSLCGLAHAWKRAQTENVTCLTLRRTFGARQTLWAILAKGPSSHNPISFNLSNADLILPIIFTMFMILAAIRSSPHSFDNHLGLSEPPALSCLNLSTASRVAPFRPRTTNRLMQTLF
jgi:hypothetical protein